MRKTARTIKCFTTTHIIIIYIFCQSGLLKKKKIKNNFTSIIRSDDWTEALPSQRRLQCICSNVILLLCISTILFLFFSFHVVFYSIRYFPLINIWNDDYQHDIYEDIAGGGSRKVPNYIISAWYHKLL